MIPYFEIIPSKGSLLLCPPSCYSTIKSCLLTFLFFSCYQNESRRHLVQEKYLSASNLRFQLNCYFYFFCACFEIKFFRKYILFNVIENLCQFRIFDKFKPEKNTFFLGIGRNKSKVIFLTVSIKFSFVIPFQIHKRYARYPFLERRSMTCVIFSKMLCI